MSRLLKYSLGGVSLLLAVLLVYVLFWRVPDSAYETQRTNLKSLQDSAGKIAAELSSNIKKDAPVNIPADTVETLRRDIGSVKTNLDSLLNSPVVTRDTAAQAAFTKDGEKLSAYVSYLSDAVSTVVNYQAVFVECRVKLAMQDFPSVTSKSELDNKASACLSAIGAAEKSPSEDLKKVLVNDYVKNVRLLVDRLQGFFDGTVEGGSRVAIIKALSTVDATVVSDDFSIPDASTSFSDFDTLLESRKATILR